MNNCPYVQERLYHAIEILQAIRVNMDCAIELDRLNSLDKHECLDEIAAAIASVSQAYELLKGVTIGYGQGLHSDTGR